MNSGSHVFPVSLAGESTVGEGHVTLVSLEIGQSEVTVELVHCDAVTSTQFVENI